MDDVAIGRADQACFIRKSARFKERENIFIKTKYLRREKEKKSKGKSWISEAAERFLSVAVVGRIVYLAVRAREQEIEVDQESPAPAMADKSTLLLLLLLLVFSSLFLLHEAQNLHPSTARLTAALPYLFYL
ncbi:hypothetical protein KFK09_000658 [Dendrobium nobile]|uniref:Uncharacterized protein n=1 Tax=Dendrobium nobile TaxID=94219 RepID=A0A8T3CBQ2_DENNO|nr:hypothetical protein KFK09_000658 [Dendrobium nobile]